MTRHTPQQPVQSPAKPVICSHGTLFDKIQEAIDFSERSRARASALAREIGDHARAELMHRCASRRSAPPSKAQLDVVADQAIGSDARWKQAVQDEQWAHRLGTMYGAAEIAAALRENNIITRALLAEQQMTNKLLAAMLNLRDTPPHQRVSDSAPSHNSARDNSV